MDRISEIAEYLNRCTVAQASDGGAGTGLSAIHKLVFCHRKNPPPKEELVKGLTPFYADPANIIDIWKALTECERDFVSYIVKYDGKEYLPTTLEYAKKYGIELKYQTKWGYERSVLEDCKYKRLKFLYILERKIPNTKAAIFFPSGKDMPAFVLEVLKTVIEPMVFEYEEYIPAKEDFIICRENRLGDFSALVQLAGSERMKGKPDTFDMTKAKLAKLSEAIGFDEVCDKDGKFCTPKEARRNNDFKVALPLFVLAANTGLVEIDSTGNIAPAAGSAEMLSVTRSELAKRLFDDYINSTDIHELHYITYISAYDGNHWINWPECRKPIIDLLKTCPGEKFIRFESFDKYAKIFCGNFFRRLLNCAVIVKGYNFGYDHYRNYNPDWDECEAQIIRLILSFLSAIGMIDIAYTENTPRILYDDDDFCVGIAGFRITKLGMWILGLADKYDEPETAALQTDEGKLLVLPDYSVMISGLKCRIEHETFLSKFLTKVSSDENAAVYKLDFQSAIRAYDNDITPKKIKAYLKKASSASLPANVERSLDDWQAKVGKVKIHKLSVLETDDPVLLEEIKHIKGMNNIILHDLPNAIAIDEDQQKKAKTIIEKNGWLVKL